MSTLFQDLRYGIRMLARNPGFTAVAVLTLALGIGGNATVFGWAQAVLLHPLSGVKDSDCFVAIETVMPGGGSYHTSSYPDYKDYRDQNHVFSGMIGTELIATNIKLPSEESAQRDWGLLVTENYFDVLGVGAVRGRTFHAADDHGAGSDPYVVLSYGFWQRRFGSDPNVIGKSIELNQHPFTVIGIAPKGFMGTIVGLAAEYWVPMMMQPEVLPGESLTYRAPTFIHMLGKLKPGVTLEQASAEMRTIAIRLQREYPDTNKDVGVYVCPLWKAHYGLQDYLLPVLAFLMAVVALVLLIACANIANLLLARATVREKEIAIRLALGANRPRLVRQLLAESLLLSLAGGLGGILVALWCSNFLGFFMPPAHLPIGLSLGVDARVLAFVIILAVCTAMIFGLAPALQASRPSLSETLKEGGRTSSSMGGRHRLREFLVIGETVLALVLLVGAGLLVRSLRSAETSSPGYNVDNVLLTAMDLRSIGYSDDQSAAFFGQLLDRIKTFPGVQSASLTRWVPLWFTGRGNTRPDIEGYTPEPNEDMDIDYNVVGPHYFSTMQIPVISGRDFKDGDRPGAPLVCVVNQTMARHFWPGQDPIGHRLNSWDRWWTVAGVVKDVKYHSMNEHAESFLYFPFLQLAAGTDANILIRTAGNPVALLGAVRQQVRALDPNATILESDNLRNLFNVSLFAYRTAATLAAVLGALGLLLAALGLYGVLSYSVSQRTHEIGIRMALGAAPGRVLALVIGQGMRLILLGLALGLAAALATTRMISSLLYGVTATDPLTFIAVSGILAVVALLACYVPARRAAKVDPIEALRYE
jgi:predicted permease